MEKKIIVLWGLLTLYSHADNTPMNELMPKAQEHDLMAATRKGDIATVERLLQEKNVDFNVRDGVDMTPFLVAVQRNDMPLIKTFMKYRKAANPQSKWFVDIHAKDAQGNNALMLALAGIDTPWRAAPLNVPLIEMLIDAGIDVNARYHDGSTILDQLVSAENLPLVIKALKAGAKANMAMNALFVAVRRANLPMVKTLLDAGANAHTVTEVENATLLMRALGPLYLYSHNKFAAARRENDLLEIAKLLIAAKIPVNAQESYFGESALMMAVRAGVPAFVELLLKEGADVTLKDKKGKTAFELADQIEDAKARSKVKALLLKAMHKK